MKSGRHGSRTWAPFDTDTCAIEMGVVVMPGGPLIPPISPAITRIRCPGVGRRGQADLAGTQVLVPGWPTSACGQVHPQLDPVEQTPDATRSSGGRSMCSNPEPAVIHWVSPLVINPPPPWESACSERPVDDTGHGLESAVGCHGVPLGSPAA